MKTGICFVQYQVVLRLVFVQDQIVMGSSLFGDIDDI